MRKLKLYLDTSVWNFFFADDAPRERDVTKEFFDVIKKEIYEIFISGVVIREVNDAPKPKQTDLLNLIGKSLLSHYNLNNSNWLAFLASSSISLVSLSACNIGVLSNMVTLKICKIV